MINSNPPYGQIDTETRSLASLSTFHFIVAGMVVLLSCVFLLPIYAGFSFLGPMTAITQSPTHPTSSAPSDWPSFLNPAYSAIGIAATTMVIVWLLAGLIVMSGYLIKKRRAYAFILFVAGLCCVFLNPLTTSLGVYTFIVMLKPTVKQLF